ncbi:MAG TPA: 2-oxoacid:acceptor oxidoreductase family protein [Acidimicrobiia bacterium]|nr:2-oxoacid:acceptor oxidoreductase family protein [Acidimicrobiia bacterium]
MTERELLVTGIGGQGVQLAAQVVARAATIEGHYVALFGVYGGMMRGGNTDASVVVGDAPLESPPLVSHTWSAIAMHDEFWAPLARKLRPGALVLVNDATFTELLDTATHHVVRVPATGIAAELGNPLGASMVMTGAYVGITGLVTLDALVAGMRESIPPYRRQHVAANEDALRAGFDHVERLSFPAWDRAPTGATT